MARDEREWPEPFKVRHYDDGDPHLYIKTTWGSVVVFAVALVAIGYWLGK